MNENLFNVKIIILNSTTLHDTNASMHQQLPCTHKKMISLGSPTTRLIACCELAPTLARQM